MTSSIYERVARQQQGHTSPAEPDITESLRVLSMASDRTVCPVFELGPLANHLVGPVSAIRPLVEDGPRHPEPGTRKADVDSLVKDACGLNPMHSAPIFDHGEPPSSPFLAVVPTVSDAAFARCQRGSDEDQFAVEAAIQSGDVDAALPVLDARLNCLLVIADRIRFMTGAPLDSAARHAVDSLAATLLGSSRFDVRSGYERAAQAWPISWRWSVAADRADGFLRIDNVAWVIRQRLLEGSES
jgi:hypothetical protein